MISRSHVLLSLHDACMPCVLGQQVHSNASAWHEREHGNVMGGNI